MAAPSRFAELINMLKEEYDRVNSENAGYKSIRAEWSRKVEEQTSELNSMFSEFEDLKRKHQLFKEQYDAEIRRLKGQSPPASAPQSQQPQQQQQQQPPQQPHQPQQPRQQQQQPPIMRKRLSPYAPLPSDTQSIPRMFPSRPLPHQPSVAPVPGVQPPAPAPRTIMSGLPAPTAPTAPPTAPTAPPPSIPSLSNSSALPRANAPPPPLMQSKMPAMNIAQHTNPARDPASFSHPIKKDVSMSIQQQPLNTPVMLVQPASGPFQQGPNRPSVISPPSANPPPSQAEHDWYVFQGHTHTGARVNMKVNLQHTIPLDSVVCCVRYSWDGQFLATGSNHAAHIFDANTGQRVATFSKDNGAPEEHHGIDRYVRAVCFSPNGEWLITGAEDRMVKVWDVRSRKVKHRLVGHGTDIYSVDASANGHFIISGSGDKKAKLWNLETGKLLSTLGGECGPSDGITSVAVSPSSQHVAAGSLDKIVRVWDVDTCRLVRQFDGHSDSVYSVAFSPDGRRLLSGSLDRTLKLWDLSMPQTSSHCRMSFRGHKDFVLSVAFSPNSQWLISGSKDRTVQFWDPRHQNMCMMLQGHKNSVISIAHSPVSRALATGSGDCQSRTWLYS